MDKKETIKVQGRSSGMWFTRKKDTEASKTSDMPQDPPKSRPAPSRSNTLWITKQPIVDEPEEEPEPQGKQKAKARTMPRPRSSRSNTVSGFWPGRMNSSATQTKDDLSVVPRPKHQKSRSEIEVVQAKKQKRSHSPEASTSSTNSQEEGQLFSRLHTWTKLSQLFLSYHDESRSSCVAPQRIYCAGIHHVGTPKDNERHQCYPYYGRFDPSDPSDRCWSRRRSPCFRDCACHRGHCTRSGSSAWCRCRTHTKKAKPRAFWVNYRGSH